LREPSHRESPDSTETGTHSFILKIWVEQMAADAEPARWRGRVTHVPSGRYRYFEALPDLCAFVVPYLEGLNVRLGFRWRLWRWLFRT